jgi:hypothetical protein
MGKLFARGYKYFILYHKKLFDIGFGLSSYLKWFVVYFGVASRDVKSTLILGFIFGIFCYALGYSWVKYKFVMIDNEISNSFNPFVKDVKQSLKHLSKNKKFI